MQIEQKKALTEREIDAAIAHYQRDKQVMQELLDMWEEESQVVTLPPKPDENPAHEPVIRPFLRSELYGLAKRAVGVLSLEKGFKKTRLYKTLAEKGIIYRLATGHR